MAARTLQILGRKVEYAEAMEHAHSTRLCHMKA